MNTEPVSSYVYRYTLVSVLFCQPHSYVEFQFGIFLYSESWFLEPSMETTIGSRNQEFEISGVKLQWNRSKGNDFWFELSGVREIGIPLYIKNNTLYHVYWFP